jgi:hypothetical protein
MSGRYSVKLLYRGVRGRFPKLKGKILEGDVWVGEFSRAAQERNYVPPITYKFYSTGALYRFTDFADSISIEEAIEALLEPAHV